MHDIVAHGLSVMIVRADGARFMAPSDPGQRQRHSRRSLRRGAPHSRRCATSLSVLRDDTAPLPEAPQPGLRDIAALVRTMVETGREVRLTVRGDVPDDAGGDAVGLTAYRTVQEALTNVMKHAGTRRRPG